VLAIAPSATRIPGVEHRPRREAGLSPRLDSPPEPTALELIVARSVSNRPSTPIRTKA
jgi:hypothetical protein